MLDVIGPWGRQRLSEFAAALYYVSYRFRVLEWDTSNWIYPFGLLSAAFGLVAEQFEAADVKVREFRDQYSVVVDRLNSILDTSGLETLIEYLFDEWRQLRTDPKGYISGKMYELLDTWGSLKDDAKRWVIYRIQEYDWYAWEWLTRPVDSLLSWLQSDYPKLHRLITDTAGGLWDMIDEVSHQGYLLLSDPKTWVRDFWTDELGWSGEFWVDPWGYLLRELGEYLDDHMATLGNWLMATGERIIRYIWNTRIYQ